jgi:hypothetical protein
MWIIKMTLWQRMTVIGTCVPALSKSFNGGALYHDELA